MKTLECKKLLQRSLNILRNSAPTFDNDEDEGQYLEAAWALHRDLMDDLIAVLSQPIFKNVQEGPDIDSTRTTAVDRSYHWQPMSTCPKSVKVQLLSQGGVAVYGQYTGKIEDAFWIGWAPLPTTLKPRLGI